MLELIVKHCDDRSAKGIAQAVSFLVRQEKLGDGDQLPPVRALAKALGVSPSTVTAAWGLLTRAGLIWTDGRRGTHIHIPLTGPKRSKRMLHPAVRFAIDLSTRLPDPALLPDIKQALASFEEPPPLSSYFDQPIIPQLETTLRARWGNAVETIALADAAVDALDQITQTFLQLGDWVAVEEVTDPQLADILDAASIRLFPLEMDEQGPTPESLRHAVEKGIRIVFLQPTCHVPLGTNMSTSRRDQLAAELGEHPGIIIVEIDLTNELSSAPRVSFADAFPNRVLQVRAFSGAYGPELRIAAIGGPQALAGELVRKRHLGQGWTSRILQAILLQFLSEPSLQQSVCAAREEYALRKQLLIEALRQYRISVTPSDGLMVWIPVEDETSTMIGLAARGLGAVPGSVYCVRPLPTDYVCLSVTRLQRDLIPKVAYVFGLLLNTKDPAFS